MTKITYRQLQTVLITQLKPAQHASRVDCIFLMLANLYMGRMHNFMDDLEVTPVSVRMLPDHIYAGLRHNFRNFKFVPFSSFEQ